MITHLSKCAECPPKVRHNVNGRLCVIMMCQRRFLSCNERTTLTGTDNNEGGYACVGAEDMGNLCPFQSILL